MEIQCANTKTVELTHSSKKLGELTYDGLFSFKALATVGDETYRITSKGIFGSTVSVTKNDQQVAHMQMNWKGHMIIAFENGQEFTLKATGAWLNKYALENKDQQKVMVLNPDCNWTRLGYEYSISYESNSYESEPNDTVLVLLSTYAANYCIAAMSAVM